MKPLFVTAVALLLAVSAYKMGERRAYQSAYSKAHAWAIQEIGKRTDKAIDLARKAMSQREQSMYDKGFQKCQDQF